MDVRGLQAKTLQDLVYGNAATVIDGDAASLFPKCTEDGFGKVIVRAPVGYLGNLR